MKHRFNDYAYGYRMVSIAKEDAVRRDLLDNQLDFLYVEPERITLYPVRAVVSEDAALCEALSRAHNYDVYEIWPDGRFFCRYDDSSLDNYFFVTGRCNSNCLMCPSPEAARCHGDPGDPDSLTELARHIPAFTPHLTVTGGEPFLIGRKIFPFLKFLQEKFEETEFLFLTNGRIFSVESFTEQFCANMPSNTILGIPLHGSCEQIHDRITQARGSFRQTMAGIRNLLRRDISVELRIVVSRLNIGDIPEIVRLIIEKIPEISYVSVMAMEMTGSAFSHREQVWVPYSTAFDRISGSILTLIRHGIDVKLYNFPLCTVHREFWPLCEKSISPEKVRYADFCEECGLRTVCGGVFAGTFSMEREDLKKIL